jgi:hypothetical protein
MALAKTFCSAPWFQVRIDWDGQYRPCCVMKEKDTDFTGRTQYSIKDTTVDQWMRSDYIQYLKKQLSNGVELAECNDCWKKEKNNVKSIRQQVNDTVTRNQDKNLDNTWVKLFVDRTPNYQDYRLISADVKLSNVCNFSCAMCGPKNSSKIYDNWKSNTDNQFVQEQLQQEPKFFETIIENYQTKRGYQHLKDILTQPIRNLKVLGGEPLLDKELFRVLQNQTIDKKSQIHLDIVTNGSLDLVEATNRLADYESVSFTISLEGVGAIQDYVREGSHWPAIEKNILNAKRHGIFVNIHHTMQALTILDLPTLLSWCYNNQISISFGVLEYPDYLSISVLSKSFRSLIIDNLSKINNINIINSADNSDLLSVNSIIELIQTLPIYSEKYPKFLEYIKWYERDFPQKLQDIQPLFYTG